MGSLLQHIFELLTTATGTLAYHLVLAFTILCAFQVAFFRLGARQPDAAQIRRLIFGLSYLLALQFFLFIVSGLAWQGVLDGDYWLPPIDRMVILLSLVCILWLWLFPKASLLGDLGAALLTLLLLVGVVAGFFWWQGQYPNLAYNSSWTDFLAQVIALLLLLMGAIVLAVRRTPAWVVGLIMLAMFALGHILHLMLPLTGEQYSGAVRATQLVAYPLLFVLALRWSEKPLAYPVAAQKGAVAALDEAANLKKDAPVLGWLTQIHSKKDEIEVCQQVLLELAQFSGAGICCYLSAAGDDPSSPSILSYSSETAALPADFNLERGQLPQFFNAYLDGKPVPPRAGENSSDQVVLAGLCKFDLQGNAFLLVPGQDAQGQVLGAALLAAPATGKMWDASEQVVFKEFMNLAAQHIARLRESKTQPPQAETVRESAPAQRAQILQAEPSASAHNDLRLALEEIAILRANLAEYEAGTASAGYPLSAAQRDQLRLDQVSHIAEDIQKPLSSLRDYTAVLLSERDGVLGVEQQKNLERIRFATERINRLVNELAQVIFVGKQAAQLSIKELKLGAHLAQTGARLADDLAQKAIQLEIEQPREELSIYSDAQALGSILEQTLRFCIDFTPAQGQIKLAARLEHKDGSPDYALVQWTSSADASAVMDLSQVFTQRQGITAAEKAGPSGYDLFKVRGLVEALGGRIWIDIDPEKRTIISMILPVIQSALDNLPGDLQADV